MDWLGQSKHSLESARLLSKGGFHDIACFHSQQAAELAVKALYLSRTLDGRGHSLTGLLKGIEGDVKVPEDVLRAAQQLDRHYIQARSPRCFDSGSPMDYFTEEDSREALQLTEEVINFCVAKIAR